MGADGRRRCALRDGDAARSASRRGDPTALADGFVTSADVLRHLQADPLLPAELLPARWPGAALRAEYDRYDAAYRATLRGWFRADRAPAPG